MSILLQVGVNMNEWLVNEKNWKNCVPTYRNPTYEQPQQEFTQEEYDTGLRKIDDNTYEQIKDKNNKPLIWQKTTMPPGMKPSDEELAKFEKIMNFSKFAAQKMGYDKSFTPEKQMEQADEMVRKKFPLYAIYGAQTAHEKTEYNNAFNTALKALQEEQTAKKKQHQYYVDMFSKDLMMQSNYKGQDAIVAQAFKEQTGKWPTATELLIFKKEQNPYTSGDASFDKWDQETQNNAIQKYLLDPKETPKFAARDSRSKATFEKASNEYMKNIGLDPGQLKSIQTSYKSLQLTNNKQQNQLSAAANFADNILKQIEYAKEIQNELNRQGIMVINKPLVAYKTRLVGSGAESAYQMLMKEISAEALKLSMGSQASIAQIPEGNRVEWEKVHNVNLPFDEMNRVLDATGNAAKIRINSINNEVNRTLQDIAGLQKLVSPSNTPISRVPTIDRPSQIGVQTGKRDISQGISYLKSAGKNKEAVKSRIKALAAKGWTREELNEIAKQSGWAK